MAAVLKKRALAEYTQVVQEEPAAPKKLRLVLKSRVQEPPLSFQGVTSSQRILEILLDFEDRLPTNSETADHALRVLLEQFCSSKDKVVRAKIASMFGVFARIPTIDIHQLVNDVIGLIQSEESHKVLSQLLRTLCTCGQVACLNKNLHQQIIAVATKALHISSHLVRVKCVEIIGALSWPEDEQANLHNILARFCEDADSRVRTAVFDATLKWHQRGIKLNQSLYEKASKALQDDYEGVRLTATKLIWVLSQCYPNGKVKVCRESEDENRLIDDGFAKICDMLNDISVRVRAEAAGLLGSIHGVSRKFLEQTLDKKLMSNMRRKKAAHERQRQNFESGGWSSGKKWADDAPGDDVDENSMTLMAMGACGAFVHGLEDEYFEVRNASIDSVCELATRSESFAMQCQDHLVDMFNDELEAIRLNAINSLRKLGQYVILREDQLEIILGCLKDFSYEIREALRLLFCTVKLATQSCLHNCIFGLLDNLKRYPQDRSDIFKTMQLLGQHHPYFTLPMVPELLSSHPYFESIEADVEDPAYDAILILVFNAAERCPTIAPLFPDHVVRHYRYLHDTLPDLVPVVSGVQERALGLPVLSAVNKAHANSPAAFMAQTLQRLHGICKMDNSNAAQLIEMCINDLSRVAELQKTLAPNASFMSSYLECHLLLCKVLSKGQNQLAQTNSFALLKKVIDYTHRMEEQFLGLAVKDISDVIQLRILAQSVQLLQLLSNNAASVKQTCVQYLQILNSFDRFLTSNKLESSSIAKALLSEMSKLESCDPSVFYSVLKDAITDYKPTVLNVSNSIRKSKAHIIEPTGSTENAVKFISGLVASVDLIANLENIESTHNIRVRVKYPDQEVHTVIPRASDFKQISEGRHRLITKVLLSHTQWSEPCHVEISLVKYYLKDREFREEKSNVKVDRKADAFVELCPSVKVNVLPKSGKY